VLLQGAGFRCQPRPNGGHRTGRLQISMGVLCRLRTLIRFKLTRSPAASSATRREPGCDLRERRTRRHPQFLIISSSTPPPRMAKAKTVDVGLILRQQRWRESVIIDAQTKQASGLDQSDPCRTGPGARRTGASSCAKFLQGPHPGLLLRSPVIHSSSSFDWRRDANCEGGLCTSR